MEMCRACLSTENVVVPINELFLKGYNLLTDLSIVLCDGLPRNTCEACAQSVKFFLEFREKCVTSEAKLQQQFVDHLASISPAPVKGEDNVDFNVDAQLQTQKVKSEESNNSCKDKIEVKKEVKEEKYSEVDSLYNDFDFERSCESYEPLLDFIIKPEKKEEIKPKRVSTRKSKRKKTLAEKVAAVVTPTILDCGLCKRSFESQEELNKHLSDHTKGKECEICHEVFSHWPGFFAHRFSHLDIKGMRCHICNRFLHNGVQTEYHYMSLHYEGEKVSLTCGSCGRQCATPLKLKKHIRTHADKKYTCDTCHKKFLTKSRLQSHILLHSEQHQFICHLCGFSSKRRQGLMRHTIHKHTPSKVTCGGCRRVFADQQKCDRHKCRSEPQVCPYCGKLFQRSNSFRVHVASHAPQKQYSCPQCPARYRHRPSLKAHLDRHRGVRTHRCPYCPRAFYSASVLVKHRRIHTGDKPYVCTICGRGFTANGNLKVHMKVHGLHLVVKRTSNNGNTAPLTPPTGNPAALQKLDGNPDAQLPPGGNPVIPLPKLSDNPVLVVKRTSNKGNNTAA